MSEVSLKELLEAGAHFGHQTRRWNPKMQRYIYGVRGGVHIMDLTKTAEALESALAFARETAECGGKVLFVGTKRQAKAIVRAEAEAAGMPFVTERWLGGMLTNFRTIRSQVNRLKKLEQQSETGELDQNYNKKEAADMREEMRKLDFILGGIKDMDHAPAALFVVDVPREKIAVAEAIKLGIPVIAITDTNADPDLVDYVIPANDDAIKAIKVLTHAVAEAVKEGAAKQKTAEPAADADERSEAMAAKSAK